MAESHDWPIERVREGQPAPLVLLGRGLPRLLFKDAEEARRALHGLLEPGVPDEDVRLYDADQVLSNEARLQEERSPLARAIAALTADHTARDRYLATRAGFGALAVCLTHERADRLIGLLAAYDYLSLRYYGSEGAEVIRRDPNDTAGNAAR